MRLKLKKLFNIDINFIGKILNIFIIILIILSIISFSIETIPNLEQTTKQLLAGFETFSVVIFTIEYIVRIYITEKKLSYIFSFYGLIDLLAILPFYLTFFIDLRTLKIFRLFRLFRLLKLTRYSKTIDRFKKAMYQAKEEFILFFILTIILFYLASVGIYYFEHEVQPKVFSSIFSSMWWAVATLTTVGYGDVYPITIGGKIFTTIILLIGLGIVGIPAGIISSALMQVDNDEDEHQD